MSVVFFAAPIALLGAGLVYQRIASRRERRLHPPTGRLVDVGGFRLHLHAMGEGRPTVVLDSALAGTSLSWSEIQPRVAAFSHVVSYDRAGFGWSEPSPSPRTVNHMVEELHGLLSKGEVPGPYVLVGHSYGGWIAQLFASRHRDEVAGLVLVDSPHPREWCEPDAAQKARVARGARLARRAALAARFGLMRWMFVLSRISIFDEHSRVTTLLAKTPPSVREHLRRFWVRPETLEALASQIEHAPESAARVAAEKVDLCDIPLVVLTAAHPSPERLADQEATAKLSRAGRHIVAKTSGHWIPLEEPELLVEAIQDVVTSR